MSEQTDERASPGWTRDTHTEQQVWTHSSGGPLHVLVTSRQTLELQRHLVVSGSDTINSRDDQGETALHVAIATNCLEAVQLLLNGGADPGVEDRHGNNALHSACLHHKAVHSVITQATSPTPSVEASQGLDFQDDSLTLEAIHLDLPSAHQTPLESVNQDCDVTRDQIGNGIQSVAQEVLSASTPRDITHQNEDGDTPLMIACREGHTDLVRLLLETPDTTSAAEVGVNLTNNLRRTALHVATQARRADIVRILLKHRASVNRRECATASQGDTALHIAVRNADLAAARALLAAGADPTCVNACGETSLYMAAKAGDTPTVQLLLGNHNPADESNQRPRLSDGVKDALIVGIRMGHEGVVRSLLWHFDGLDLKSALLAASMAGNEAIMTSLLTHVQSDMLQFSECVDSCCQSLAQHAVILATRFGHLQVLKLLSEAGCPVDIKFSCSRTLLHEASLNGHTHVARFLLRAGVNINARDYFGRTSLMDAVCSNKVDIIQTMVEHVEGRDGGRRRGSAGEAAAAWGEGPGGTALRNPRTAALLNVKDYAGNTYLHMAATRGHVDVVEYLLACGCPDIMSRDVHGATPLHAAAYARRQDVVACLVQFLISQRNNAHLAHNTSWHTREVPSSPSDPGRCATLESKRENLPNPLDPEDASGATPLVLAVRNADLPTVVLLLNAGSSVTKLRSGLQPPVTYGLILANQPGLISALLAAGAPLADIQYLLSTQRPSQSSVSRQLSTPTPGALSLKDASRIAVRRALHTDMRTKAQHLPLPNILKNFVLLQEFV